VFFRRRQYAVAAVCSFLQAAALARRVIPLGDRVLVKRLIAETKVTTAVSFLPRVLLGLCASMRPSLAVSWWHSSRGYRQEVE
jgi:hypothetical protein